MKTFFKLLFTTLSLILFGSVVVEFYGVAPMAVVQFYCAVTAVLVAVRLAVLFKNPTQGTRIAQGLALDLAVEFWDTVIAQNLFKGYEWVMRAKDRSGNVLNNSVVHIPQAGALPNVVRNRKNYPIGKVKRNDNDLTYVIDELSSDTTVVFEAEKWELSYSKIPDVLKDHINQLNKIAAQNALYRWLGKNTNEADLTKIVKTTGGVFNSATYYSTMTGNRKLPLVADIAAAKTVLVNNTKKEINPGKRALIMDENFYTLLLTDAVFANNQQYDKIGAVFKDGDLMKLHGFDIIRTDVMPYFSSGDIAKDALADGYAAATDDNPVAALVDFDFVHVAKGSAKLFYRAEDVDYQGDIMNAQLRMGASRERKDDAGVVAIVADA